jgi:mannosyltransferase
LAGAAELAGGEGSRRQHAHRANRVRRVPGWVLLLVPGMALLLADGYGLGRLSLWRDEAYTVDAAHRPVLRILAMLGHTDAVNNAYYVVMHAVIAVAGTSAAVLRLPSLLAMAVAAVFTAAIGSRLARATRLPAPALTGAVAGLLFAAAPEVTRYAQDARSYGLVTMCATVATYLLLRALADGRWCWWAGYGAAIVAAGLFNLLALLLLAAHGVSVWMAHSRQRAALAPPGPADTAPADEGTITPRPPAALPGSRWLIAAGAAVAAVSPLLVFGFGQRRQINWLARPGLRAVSHLVVSFAGSRPLVALLALLVVAGVAATVAARPRAALDMVTVALPWLVVPATILLAVSRVHPVYDARYVIFCLRRVTAIVAAHARRGDAVLYLPSHRRVVSMAYPVPFRRLRDVALAKSPVAAVNLVGTEVPAAMLRARFATVGRVWVVSGRRLRPVRHPAYRLTKAKIALLGTFRLVQRWHVGRGMLSLYRRG